jgi:hypothetical protein
MPYKFKTTKHNTMWAVQVSRKEKGQGGSASPTWQTIVDDKGPLVLRTRKVARDISREFRNTNKNNRFRIAKIVVP